VKPASRIALSLFLTLLFLALFARSFDLGSAGRALSSANLGLVALSAGVNLAAYGVRAWRWRALLAPIRRGVGLYNLTSTTMIGFMISFLVPFRIGEVVRPVLLARRERLHAGAALATIALERLLDTLTVMILFAVFMLSARGASLLSAPPGGETQAAIFLRRGVVAAAAFVVLGLPIAALLVAAPARVVAVLHRLNPGERSGPVGRAIGSIESFVEGFGALRRARDLVPCLALSLALWLAIDLSVLLGVKAFGLPLRFTDVFLLIVPLAVGIVVPTPGGVGPYEFLGQTSLAGFWGVAASRAAATAVTLHAATLVPTIGVGLLFMWRDGLRIRDVRQMTAAPAGRPSSGGGTP
jgi:glycosyltransferase 2 family protein